jgi:hypothetical protein
MPSDPIDYVDSFAAGRDTPGFMGSKTTLVLALVSSAALAVAGASLALYLTEPNARPLGGVTVTQSVTEAVTQTVTQASPAGQAPPALSTDGRLIWDLEALLRGTFGTSQFYLHYLDDVARFDQEFAGACCSESWNFVFANASASQL